MKKSFKKVYWSIFIYIFIFLSLPSYTFAAPRTPTGLITSPGLCGTGEIHVSAQIIWEDPTITGYQFNRDGVRLYSYDSNRADIYDYGLTAGQTYSYTVQSLSTSGTSTPSSPVVGIAPPQCMGVPPTPISLTAAPNTCGTNQIILNWASSLEATDYEVFRNGVQIYPPPGYRYQDYKGIVTQGITDINLIPGQIYNYTVRAINSNGASALTGQVSGTAPAVCVGSFDFNPSWPYFISNSTLPDVIISKGSSGQITLPIFLTSGVTRSINTIEYVFMGGSLVLGAEPAGVAVASTSQVCTPSPTCNIVANLSVDATAQVGTYLRNGFQTETIYSGSTVGGPPIHAASFRLTISPISVPTGFTATPNSCGTGSVNLSWSPTPGATKYQVYRNNFPLTTSASASFLYSGINGQVYSGSIPSFSDTGLTAGQSYYYTVLEMNGSGVYSAQSLPIKIRAPFRCLPVAPATINVSASTGSASWTILPGNITGSGASASYTVNPALGGTTYTIFPNSIPGFLTPNNQSAFVLPGDLVSFSLSYVPIPPPPPAPGVGISASVPSGIVGVVNPTITWTTTNNPDYCTASGDWSGNPLTLGGNQLMGILNTARIWTYTITCTNAGGTSLPSSATVLVSLPQAPGVAIIPSVPSGIVGIVNPTLTWTTTNNPDYCTASGDWSGNPLTLGGNQSMGILNTARIWTYTITCTNLGGTSLPASAYVVVSNPPPLKVSCTASSQLAQVGQPVTYTATATDGTPPYTYAWSSTDLSTTPTTNSFTISYQATGKKTANVVVTDKSLATAPCQAQSTIQIYVRPKFKEF
jgi:hypothetical protein